MAEAAEGLGATAAREVAAAEAATWAEVVGAASGLAVAGLGGVAAAGVTQRAGAAGEGVRVGQGWQAGPGGEVVEEAAVSMEGLPGELAKAVAGAAAVAARQDAAALAWRQGGEGRAAGGVVRAVTEACQPKAAGAAVGRRVSTMVKQMAKPVGLSAEHPVRCVPPAHRPCRGRSWVQPLGWWPAWRRRRHHHRQGFPHSRLARVRRQGFAP